MKVEASVLLVGVCVSVTLCVSGCILTGFRLFDSYWVYFCPLDKNLKWFKNDFEAVSAYSVLSLFLINSVS